MRRKSPADYPIFTFKTSLEQPIYVGIWLGPQRLLRATVERA
jgi:hypothetical protein